MRWGSSPGTSLAWVRRGRRSLGSPTQRERDAWIEILAANPILIERPIVIAGRRAAVGRPPENVLAIL